MGPIALLVDVIEKLAEFGSDDTIYAAEPWTLQSEAIVTREPDEGGLPTEAADTGMKSSVILRDNLSQKLACLTYGVQSSTEDHLAGLRNREGSGAKIRSFRITWPQGGEDDVQRN